MILTELPDLPPRPLTARVAAFRRDFYRRWGRENCIVSGMSRHAEYGLFRQTLSIKCAAQGSEVYFVDRRRVTVSDDTFLVLNEGRVYASSLNSATDTYSFSIFFRPGLGDEIAAGLQRPLDSALEDGSLPVKGCIEFDESLQHHNSKITPVLRFIQRQIAAGVRDENWLEEQCQFLLERLITAHHQRESHLASELEAACWTQRAELFGGSAGPSISCTRTSPITSRSQTSQRRRTSRGSIFCGCSRRRTGARPLRSFASCARGAL